MLLWLQQHCTMPILTTTMIMIARLIFGILVSFHKILVILLRTILCRMSLATSFWTIIHRHLLIRSLLSLFKENWFLLFMLRQVRAIIIFIHDEMSVEFDISFINYRICRAVQFLRRLLLQRSTIVVICSSICCVCWSYSYLYLLMAWGFWHQELDDPLLFYIHLCSRLHGMGTVSAPSRRN